MLTNSFKTIIIISLFMMLSSVYAQTASNTQKNVAADSKTANAKIKWYTMEEAIKQNKKHPKKIFIDVFTDWCGWCKKLDATTFTNPVIVKYMNEHFYAVKFNAETGDTIRFRDTTYTNRFFGSRNPHDLAVKLLNSRMGYPSLVLLDEKLNSLNLIQSYLMPHDLEVYLKYYGDNVYKKQTLQEYFATFQGEIKD